MCSGLALWQSGSTALHFGVCSGNNDVVKLLLGASENLPKLLGVATEVRDLSAYGSL